VTPVSGPATVQTCPGGTLRLLVFGVPVRWEAGPEVKGRLEELAAQINEAARAPGP
jgi:hypothetical protein